ncbi:MAG: helix-turn-helix domain-containing protein [Brasilonema octagenarum HA4186-MV1]|jgi:transcriptional regulator with XRE-family HTH domain|uniref:XRE family transcriptional regulator n=2 Tax=Brasilonema TaxID=383614 RepID=A0A856MFJ7_9CYAN|nr:MULTISPECIES: helix-turn-helix transcriptional regulator [Brasilonema]MBW4626859.1 helix-turn-helix domain-containing protein [Brasilonema octagenarum HA4186-MV1]NMF67225.1 XRE family transcriptional regulator [Brasilonema octagenarum UFV-OR1]QDL07847.1 XRE family transcriptional regulator [Brasilonema sennae CENA114]QDL14207.1 XRE family transcriptional regulator [Brasilonema octagenarum UFV-E1]
MDMQVLRERAGLSRAEVAFRLAISETSVRNWEAGRTEPTMTPKKYLDALRLFKCTPEELAAASEKSINQRHKRKPGRPRRFPENSVNSSPPVNQVTQVNQVTDSPSFHFNEVGY